MERGRGERQEPVHPLLPGPCRQVLDTAIFTGCPLYCAQFISCVQYKDLTQYSNDYLV